MLNQVCPADKVHGTASLAQLTRLAITPDTPEAKATPDVSKMGDEGGCVLYLQVTRSLSLAYS